MQLRLAVERQLIVFEGAAQVAHQGEPTPTFLIQIRGEDRIVAPRPSGFEHRHASAPQQHVGFGTMTGKQRNTRMRMYVELEFIHLDRTVQPADDALRHLGRVIGVGLRQQQREFGFPHPGYHLARQGDLRQLCAEGLEQPVTLGVPEGIVDLLQIIEAHQQKPKRTMLLARGGKRRLQLLAQPRPVGQPGQRVRVRHVPDCRLGLLVLAPHAEIADAIGQIVGQLGKKRHLGLAEGVGLGRCNRQGAYHFPFDTQRESAGRSVAEADRLRAPRRRIRVRREIPPHAGFAPVDRHAERTASAFTLRPADVWKGARFIRHLGAACNDGNGLVLVALRIADAAFAVAALLDDDAAHAPQQFGFVGGAQQHSIARAERSQGAVQSPQLLRCLLSLRKRGAGRTNPIVGAGSHS